ncbi:histidine kinase [Marisediminicola sp. LYQ85]|uniref:sensor histidine kinase n=1 Tax=Marisediminicola sp. LYQ85 TaxID=3391062 RepID=UPI003983615B
MSKPSTNAACPELIDFERSPAASISRVRTYPALEALRVRPWRLLFTSSPWAAILYLASGVILAFPTIFVVIIFPLLPAWARTLSAIERRRVTIVGLPIISEPRNEAVVWSWTGLLSQLRELRTWREIGATLVHFLFAALNSLVLLVGTSFISASFAAPVLSALGNAFQVGDWRAETPLSLVLLVVLAMLLLLVFGYLCVLISGVQAVAITLLLGNDTEPLERQVGMLADAQVSLIDAFEAERHRIERDLHDGPQQHLAGAAMLIGLGRAELEEAQSSRGVDLRIPLKKLDLAQDEIDQSFDALRAAVSGLRPRVLVEQGLGGALQSLATSSAINITVTSNLRRRLAFPIEASLYSVATEFVANAIKHAEAAIVTIQIESDETGLQYSLTDDGRGGADPHIGTGLIGIQHRVSLLHGRCTLSSPDGGPTALHIVMPTSALAIDTA